MADLLGIETQTIKTEKGLIIPTLLDEYLKNNTCKIFFLTSFAGYMAEQPIEDIYQICDEHEVMMVEDASGSVGDHSGKLACGKHAHIIIASTGSPKILNVGNGGFISTDRSELFQSSRNVLKTLRPSPLTCTGILNEIKYAPDIFKKTVQACGYFKKNIQNVSHKDKRGMNVCLEVDEPDYVSKIIKKNILVFGSNFVTNCPTYERIMEPAVCLEIKNIDIKCLEKEYLNRILEIVIDIDKDM
jgi:hypothetical protein